MDNLKEKIFKKQTIFLLLGLVIIAEIFWASWFLLTPSPAQTNLINQTVFKKPTTITLTTPQTEVKVGDKFSVSINISSDKKTDGADLIINYDSSALIVEASGSAQPPVSLGSLYSDYPINTLNSEMGKITVSGISSIESGILADGLFGSITFTAKKVGPTSISLDFTKGSTVDTNVTGTQEAADILESVNKLEINILP